MNSPEARDGSTGEPDARCARVLVVDDEVAQMEALRNTLRDHGYETAGFNEGASALIAMRDVKFDLLLADLMMPGMDGLALLQSARQLDPDIAGIIMTGEGTIATAVEAMKAGALDYILKPFRVSIILPVLSRALAMRLLRMKNAELERRLRQRADDLEDAYRELESFSYSISHDLRAPLRAVDGYARMLEEDYGERLDHEGRRLLAVVRASGVKMARLIDDLLAFSHLGRREPAKCRTDMTTLVREVIAELPRPADTGLTLSELPASDVDRSLLRQVWVNLIGNALKYSGKRLHPHIEIGGRGEEHQNIYWVRDNGVGFDMRYAEKLFGVFQRLHSDEEFPGTGVGLAIVQRVVAKHGGRVWAESRLNEGACFYFSLPGDAPGS